MKQACKKCGKRFNVLSKKEECFHCNQEAWTKDNQSIKGVK